MADRVSSGLRVIGSVALMACLFVVVAIGLNVAARDDSTPDSSEAVATSFEGATEVGEIEGRRIYS